MPRQIYVNQNTPVSQVFVNDGGVWKEPTEIWINQGGVWKQVYPYQPGSQIWTIPGTYLWQVPSGVTTVYATLAGAGGGGGARFQTENDFWVGGGGSSGGYYSNIACTVIPGQYMQIKVGQGGAGGLYVYSGSPGESSYISGYLEATGGGGGGAGFYGENGSPGLPNGVFGELPCTPELCGYGYDVPRLGGVNALSQGSGGTGGWSGGAPTAGANGYVSITW